MADKRCACAEGKPRCFACRLAIIKAANNPPRHPAGWSPDWLTPTTSRPFASRSDVEQALAEGDPRW